MLLIGKFLSREIPWSRPKVSSQSKIALMWVEPTRAARRFIADTRMVSSEFIAKQVSHV